MEGFKADWIKKLKRGEFKFGYGPECYTAKQCKKAKHLIDMTRDECEWRLNYKDSDTYDSFVTGERREVLEFRITITDEEWQRFIMMLRTGGQLDDKG